jgi:hypothetical protein
MPIVDRKYEMKIGTTFATVEEGIAEIKRMIQKSRRIRISNIPMNLLEELKPLFKDKDLMIILPINETPKEELKQLAPTATTKARIYVDYKGEEANSGSILRTHSLQHHVGQRQNSGRFKHGVRQMRQVFSGNF